MSHDVIGGRVDEKCAFSFVGIIEIRLPVILQFFLSRVSIKRPHNDAMRQNVLWDEFTADWSYNGLWLCGLKYAVLHRLDL